MITALYVSFPVHIPQTTSATLGVKVTDVTSSAIRCYEADDTSAGLAEVATVTAGSTVGFKADNTMGHPGVSALFWRCCRPLSILVFFCLHDPRKPIREFHQRWSWKDLVQDLGVVTVVVR